MAYNKTVWVTDDLITADKLNNIEDGLENVSVSGTIKQVVGFDADGNLSPVTLGVGQFSDIGGIPPFANGVLTATGINPTTGDALIAFLEFSTSTPKSGTFPTYGTNGVLKVANGVANTDAVNKGQLDAKPSIGTTATTAKAGNYTPTATEIVTAINAMTPEQVTAVQTKLGITPTP